MSRLYNSFKIGPKYLPGVTAVQLRILIILVQLDIRMLKKLDADQFHYLDDDSIDVRLSWSIPDIKFINKWFLMRAHHQKQL